VIEKSDPLTYFYASGLAPEAALPNVGLRIFSFLRNRNYDGLRAPKPKP